MKRWSGNALGQILLPHLPARLPDRGKDGLRGDEAFVELHPEKPGFLIELHPDDAGDIANLGAHGVGTAGSEKAALFLHTLDQ
jgi:hypothetical protein